MKTSTLLFLALFLFACNGQTRKAQINTPLEADEMNNKNLLEGKWELFKVVCCGRNAQEKLVDKNDRKSYLKFYTDKKLVKTFDMGFLVDKSTYSFTNLLDQPDSPVEFIQIGKLNPAMFIVENDTLTLSWEYMDLERKYYKRVK